MRRLLPFILLATLVLLGGCGQQKSNKIVLRWSAYAFPEYDKFRYEQSALFEKLHPEVKIDYEPVSGNYNSKIVTQVAGNTAPDMFFVPPNMYYDLAQRGALMDMTPYLDKTFLNEFFPAIVDNVRYNGKIYGLVSNCSFPVLYYNKDIFDRMKVPYPTNDMTLEEMVKLAQKMTLRKPDGKVEQYGLINAITWQQVGVLYGGVLWNKDGTRCNINSEPFRKGIMFTRDVYAKYKVAPFPEESKDIGVRQMFLMGKAAMYLGETWEIAPFSIQKQSTSGLNFGAAMLPVPEGGKRAYLASGNILGVSAASKHKELALELAGFMCSSENIKFLIGKGDSVPLRVKGKEMDYLMKSPAHPSDVAQNIRLAMQYLQPYNSIYSSRVSFDKFDRTIKEELDKYIILGQSLDKTIKEMDARIEESFK